MAWEVVFYATAEGSVPGADFLDGCPAKVRGTILAFISSKSGSDGGQTRERHPIEIRARA
jgi:hypothetical protein